MARKKRNSYTITSNRLGRININGEYQWVEFDDDWIHIYEMRDYGEEEGVIRTRTRSIPTVHVNEICLVEEPAVTIEEKKPPPARIPVKRPPRYLLT